MALSAQGLSSHVLRLCVLMLGMAIEVFGAYLTKTTDFILNCPPQFTYGVLRKLVEEGSLLEVQKIKNSMGPNENVILYGLTEMFLDTDVSTMGIRLPELDKMDLETSSKFRTFISCGYVFDCKDLQKSTRFLFWAFRHLDLHYISGSQTFSILKFVLRKASEKFGEEWFRSETPIQSISLSEVILQSSKDTFPSRKQINEAIRKFTSTSLFLDPQGAIDLPDISGVPISSIEDKRLRNRVSLLQKGNYAPKINEPSQIQTVRYIIRTSRYYLNRYISPEIAYKMWSVIYNTIMGLSMPEFRYEMVPFIIKKSNSDTWPHEADVLEAISESLTKFKINHKPLSIHSKWYARLKKEGYMLTVPQNIKTARWFCRFFQHHLHIIISPYLQFNIWKSTIENLLEPHVRRISVSDDKCFFREDPKFPWPTCHKISPSDPNYVAIEHDKVLDNISHEFARIIHNFNPGYPFHDICEVTRLLISSESYRREVRQPASKIKFEIRRRMLERKTYLRNLVRSYNLARKYEPLIKPSSEMIFFFKYYIENGIPLNNKIADKIASEKFMDEDLEDIVKTRNFVIDCAKVYSSIASRELWNDYEVQDIPTKGKKAISLACSNLFYSRPKCRFRSIPHFHPARDSSDILSGEFSLRIFSYFRSVGILNVTPEEFCDESIHILSEIFRINPKSSELALRSPALSSKLQERDRFIRNALLKFKTIDISNKQRYRSRKMNEMLEQIVKSKLQEKLKPRIFEHFVKFSARPSDFSKKEDGSEWEIEELKDMIRLGRKFTYYTSFRQFPTSKFRSTCNKLLNNIILRVKGLNHFLEQKKSQNPSLKLSDEKISSDFTRDLCFSLGNWQQSIKKRIKNRLEFLWLKMSNNKHEYWLLDPSLIPTYKFSTQKYYVQAMEANTVKFYNALGSNLKNKFPHLEFKLPNTSPLEPEVLRLRKLGYECPPPKSHKSDALPTAIECVRYLYRYGLYIFNGLVFDFETLYKLYHKSFRESGFEVVAFLPNSFPSTLKVQLLKTSVFDYNFLRFETICSLNKMEMDVYWDQFFLVVESISRDIISQLHSSNIILPGTVKNNEFPKGYPRTKIRYICEFIARILNPDHFFTHDDNVEDFFKGQILDVEHKKGLVWLDLEQIRYESAENIPNGTDKNILRSLYTVYFIQSCIHSIMKYFPGIHLVHATVLCRKTKEWRTCDETIPSRDDYLSFVEIGEPMEDAVLRRLLKGAFVDMVTFELQEKAISLFWTSRSQEISDDRLPISYIRFCPIALRIHNYLYSGRFKSFSESCIFALETDRTFRVEIDGEMYTIKRSLAQELCSNTPWSQDCTHPTIQNSARFLYDGISKALKLPSPILPESIFCGIAYKIAFSKDPVNLCFRPNTFENVRAKVGTFPYSQDTRNTKRTHEERVRTKSWDSVETNPEDSIDMDNDPMGMLGHIARTYSLTEVQLGDLRKVCNEALVSLRDCSRVPSFIRNYPEIARSPEKTKLVTEEALRLFYPLLIQGQLRNFEEVPLRIATFVELCDLAVSTYGISPDLFNTACVASFGWDKSLNSNLEIWKTTSWEVSILYCSSVSKWKSCSEWAEANMFSSQDPRFFELVTTYSESTPLQRAVVDFLASFFSSNVSLFLSGANTQSITEDPRDLAVISMLRKRHETFCPVAAELLLGNKIFGPEQLDPKILEQMRSNEVSYSEVRRSKPNVGIPYLLFNKDCPGVLTKHISELVEVIKKRKADDVPKQWFREERILEFSVRVCKKHFSWMNCKFSKEVLGRLNPLEINEFEYVASVMYYEYILNKILTEKSMLENGQKHPTQREFDLFCRLSVNIISEHPRLLNRLEVEDIVSSILPSKAKKFSQEITNAFFESYENYHKGVKFVKDSQLPKEPSKFSFA
ncbi:signal peptide, large secreted protein [Cryptosporidium felis]|nr:signal peptide, large secreted protein [Cryptosporidium felis]